MPRLVATDATGTAAFVEELRRAWEAGDAVLPVDPRLPRPARERLTAALRAGDDVEPGDALVVATSGTTGEPKGVVLTHEAVAASAHAVAARLRTADLPVTWLACLPLAHVGGLSVVTRALLLDQALVVHDGFDAARVHEEALRAAGPVVVSLVATALARLPDPAAFHRIVLGGSAPPPEVPPNTHTTYGMTETGSGVVYDGVPLDDVEVRIDDAGQVHVRGPMLLRGYRDGSDPRDPAGWLPTGDAGRFDDHGRLVVEGRMADVVVTGGEKVWPDPVERALRSLPAVADVAVAGVPDPEWGQRVVAWVVPADPASPPSLEACRTAVKRVLPAYAAPRQVVTVASVPRTALGKVRRTHLPDPES